MDNWVIYFIECKGFIKIGFCKKANLDGTGKGNVQRELQRGNPFALKIRAYKELGYTTQGEARKEERAVHEHFECLRLQGDWFYGKPEWFREDPGLSNYWDKNGYNQLK